MVASGGRVQAQSFMGYAGGFFGDDDDDDDDDDDND